MENTNKDPQAIPGQDMDTCDECGIGLRFDALTPIVKLVEGRAVFDRLVCRPCEAQAVQADQDAEGGEAGR